MRPMPILMIRDEDTAPQVTGGTPAPRPPLAHGGRDLVVRTEPLWHGSGEAHLAHVAVSVRFDRPRRVAVVWDDSDLLWSRSPSGGSPPCCSGPSLTPPGRSGGPSTAGR